jgi:hypothetical protein
VLLKNSRSIFRTNTEMYKDLTSPIPIEKFINDQDIYWAWEIIRNSLNTFKNSVQIKQRLLIT